MGDLPVQLSCCVFERILVKLPEKRPPNALTFPASYIPEFITLLGGRFAEFWWLDSWLLHPVTVKHIALLAGIHTVPVVFMLPEAFCLRCRAFLLTLLLSNLHGS